jgi:hypothetical protein
MARHFSLCNLLGPFMGPLEPNLSGGLYQNWDDGSQALFSQGCLGKKFAELSPVALRRARRRPLQNCISLTGCQFPFWLDRRMGPIDDERAEDF